MSRSVEFRIERVEILGIQVVLHDPERFTEPLKVNDFPFAEEFDRISYIGIVYETKDIVIGSSGFLFCCTFI